MIYLLEEMFWRMGFSTELQSENCIIVLIFAIIVIVLIIAIILITSVCRLTLTRVLRITFGKINAMSLQRLLKILDLTFVLCCVMHGSPTFKRHILQEMLLKLSIKTGSWMKLMQTL